MRALVRAVRVRALLCSQLSVMAYGKHYTQSSLLLAVAILVLSKSARHCCVILKPYGLATVFYCVLLVLQRSDAGLRPGRCPEEMDHRFRRSCDDVTVFAVVDYASDPKHLGVLVDFVSFEKSLYY